MDPKIVIIGAGASGIAALTKLLEFGFKNVTILEAEDRIGGRINTIPFASNVVDLGAQWCDNGKDNVVYEMVKNFNLLDSTISFYQEVGRVRSNGEEVDQNITNKLKKIIHKIVENLKTESQNNETAGDYISRQFSEALEKPENLCIDKKLAQETLEFFLKFENCLISSDTLFDVSKEQYSIYQDCEGDHCQVLSWKDKGYKTFLNILLYNQPTEIKNSPIDKKIILNKSVTEIHWDRSKTDKVLIKCDDGDDIEADHVICTVSLGVLKERHPELFIPELPEEKQLTIKGLSFGTVNKLFLVFEKPFWPKDCNGFEILWDYKDHEEIRNSNNNWLQDVTGFYVLHNQSNTLLAWICGRNSRRMELLSEKEVLDGLLLLLRKCLPRMTVPEPIQFKRTTWYNSRNFRGSYMYRSMLTQKLQVKGSDLAAPITRTTGSPILQFAGEATNDYRYATVHGAVETGWREANRLANFYSTRKHFI